MIRKIERIDFLRDQFGEACNHELAVRDLVREQFRDWVRSLRPSPVILVASAIGVFANISAFDPLSVGITAVPEWFDYYIAGIGAAMLADYLPRMGLGIASMLSEFVGLFRVLRNYRDAKIETERARSALSRQRKIGRDYEQ